MTSALIAAFAPGASLAQSAAAAPRVVSAVHIPGTATTFDWLAKKRVAKRDVVQDAVLLSSADQPQVTQKRFFGHGSYICSPAGFGKKSRCFAR